MSSQSGSWAGEMMCQREQKDGEGEFVESQFVEIFNENHTRLKTRKPAFQTYYRINDARGSALIISAEARLRNRLLDWGCSSFIPDRLDLCG